MGGRKAKKGTEWHQHSHHNVFFSKGPSIKFILNIKIIIIITTTILIQPKSAKIILSPKLLPITARKSDHRAGSCWEALLRSPVGVDGRRGAHRLGHCPIYSEAPEQENGPLGCLKKAPLFSGGGVWVVLKQERRRQKSRSGRKNRALSSETGSRAFPDWLPFLPRLPRFHPLAHVHLERPGAEPYWMPPAAAAQAERAQPGRQ